MLGESCFKIMLAQLHFNMGNMSSSYMLNSEVPEMRDALAEELQYALRFWGTHLAHIQKEQMVKLAKGVNDFLHRCFLYWLEVVSILGCFREAIEALSKLRVAGLGEVSRIK
jgi:hypothetical protein